jgi:NAD(P)-dependent dehydrogenase (short-subunit alcohol dehydrogenase family)
MEPGERLPGKVAIVTGGASGIGAETARTFARHGASVVLCDLQDELGLTVAGEIVAAGGVGEYRHLDVTQEDRWTALAADVEAKYGHIERISLFRANSAASRHRGDSGCLWYFRPASGQFAVIPPSITNSLPVTQAASSDAK